MAWQLIYTSAPRSLEAGRSGFGSVARHRAITPLLVAAIERASQFSRLPGVDTNRVIYSYRIVTIAGGRFHVLSSIRDSGADYTGRTNHIAHHLVAEPREIAQLGTAGPSPVDVLLGMPWCTSWSEPPRYLEAADEIPLVNFPPLGGFGAWEAVTGAGAQAWLLASGEASRGAYVISPAGLDLRGIFGESLRLMPERLWQISLTTSLQPSDEPADFRWIGVEQDSPMRAQTETSGRPVFNLAQPESLPVVQGVERSTAVAAATSVLPPPTSLLREALPRAASPHIMPAPSGPVWTAPPAHEMPQLPSEPATLPRSRRRSGGRGLWLATGAAVAAAALVVLLPTVILPDIRNYQHRKATREAIAEILGRSGYFPPRVATELQSAEAVDQAKALAEEANRSWEVGQRADFDAMSALPDEGVRDAARAANINTPLAINDLDSHLHELGEIHRWLHEFQARPDDDQALAQIAEHRLQADAILSTMRQGGGFERIAAAIHVLAGRQSARQFRAMLVGASEGRLKPTQDRAMLERLFQDVPVSSDAETTAILNTAHQILEGWKVVDEAVPEQSTALLEARLKEQSRDGTWPAWLRSLAESKIKPSRTAAVETAPPRPASAQPAVESSAPARLPLFFVSDGAQFSVDLPVPLPAVNFFLHVEGRNDEELKPFAGDVSKGLGPFGESFKIQNGRLVSGSKPPQPPYVVIGRHEGTDLFRVHVGMGRDDKPVFGSVNGGLKRDGDELVVDLSKLPGAVSQPLSLRLPPGFGLKDGKIAVIDLHGDRGSIRQSIQELKDQLARLNGGSSAGDLATADTEDGAIRAAVRKLSFKPKPKVEKKTPGAKPIPGNSGDVSADVGQTRPAGMLASLFEKYWDAQVGSKPNPAEKIQAELAKKSEQADWLGLLKQLQDDFNYGTADWIGKSEYDARLAWAHDAEALAGKVCNLELRRQAAQKNATVAQARATQAAGEASKLGAHPLLNGQIPSGTYTLLVGDGDRKLSLLDFRLP